MWAMQQFSYERRLDTLNLYSFSYRQDQGELVTVYRILKGHFGVELNNWFRLDVAGMWGHPIKML